MSAVLPTPTTPVPPTVAKAAAAVKPLVELTAADRLTASRGRLRDAMMSISHPAPDAPSQMSGLFSGLPHELLRSAKRLPGAAIVIEALQAWWKQHPLRTAGTMAGHAARNIVVPMAQRSPVAFVGSAVVVGALLVVSRPWRWLIRPALFMGIVPQLVAQVLKRYPAESLVRMATGLMTSRPKRATPRATRPAAPL